MIQLVFDLRLFDEANLAPTAWGGENNNTRVCVIETSSNAILAIIVEAEPERVGWASARKTGARIRLIVDVVTIECIARLVAGHFQTIRNLIRAVQTNRENLSRITFRIGPQERRNVVVDGSIGKSRRPSCSLELC